MKTAPCLLLGLGLLATPAQAARVGVLPLGGSASAAERDAATSELTSALSGIPGLELVDLAQVNPVLGSEGVATLSRCADDLCRRQALEAIRTDRLIFGELDREGERVVLRLRLYEGDPKGTPEPKVRLSREIAGASLAKVAGEVVAELFPEESKSAFGNLVLSGGAPETLVAVDGKLVGGLDGDRAELSLRLIPGPHRIEARAPGHHPYLEQVELSVGKRRAVQVSMDKNRSVGPYVLAGAGVVAAGVATGLGLAVNARASDWTAACPANQPCSAGYTRARYDEDQAFVDRGRLSTNGLWVVATGALVGAVVWYLFDPGVDVDLEGSAP